MTEENVNEEVPVQSSIGIFPTPEGIVLEISDGDGKKTLVLDPDDASKIAVNLISNVVLFQLNNSMRMAAERAEMERIKSSLMGKGQGAFNIDDILKKT